MQSTLFTDAAYNTRYRYKALYQKADGEPQEVVYWTDPGNIYPLFSARRTAPIGRGSSFTLKYLPLFPSAFIFIADQSKENSRACSKLKDEIRELNIRLEVASDNVSYQQALIEKLSSVKSVCGD